jgi:type I restriction enzyme S subunit
MKSERTSQFSGTESQTGMISLRDVATINEATINPKSLDWLNYTDIASVGTRTVESPQMITGKNAPGRARRVLRHGDTVLSTVRPNRKSYFQFKDDWDRAIASTGFAVISPKNFQDADYLYAVLTSDAATLHYESLCEGGAYPAFNPRTIEEMQIPWPSPEERNVMGGLSASILRKIETNGHLARTLEEIAQTIFKSWFIDFDPVKTKMAGEKPAGMDDATAALFPNSMEDSELGPIPKGWGHFLASEIFEVGIGRTPPRKESKWFCDNGNGIDWVSIRDMGTYGVFADGTNEGLTAEAVQKFRVPIVPKGTVLMSFKLTVGKLCITDRDLVTNEAIAHFKETSKSTIGSIFAYLWLANQNMANLDSTSSIGTATNSAIVKAMKFLVPSEKVHSAFIKVVGEMFADIENLTAQTNQLIEVRDAMLPRLISGELPIPEEMLVS